MRMLINMDPSLPFFLWVTFYLIMNIEREEREKLHSCMSSMALPVGSESDGVQPRMTCRFFLCMLQFHENASDAIGRLSLATCSFLLHKQGRWVKLMFINKLLQRDYWRGNVIYIFCAFWHTNLPRCVSTNLEKKQEVICCLLHWLFALEICLKNCQLQMLGLDWFLFFSLSLFFGARH